MHQPDLDRFLADFHQLTTMAVDLSADPSAERFGELLTAHFGGPLGELTMVSEEVLLHRFADWDIAIHHLSSADPKAREVGVAAGPERFFQKFTDFITGVQSRCPVGPPDHISMPVGHDRYRRVVGFGIRLFHYENLPVAVMQRFGERNFGAETGDIEVLCADARRGERLLAQARELAIEHSVVRGQVIAFGESGYQSEGQGIMFLQRPSVREDQVILPTDSLARIVHHVGGVADHAEDLKRYGQHLKRGVLLYGPPGAGKTHTVRHLISRNSEHTVVLLVGQSLKKIGMAAQLARALQPALVVIEDCDLVAEDRELGAAGRPLLFEILDVMDGLDADADVTFILTTNRVQVLEPALAQRPGRVDLAVNVPLPDLDGRRRLLDLYRGEVSYSPDALAEAAARTDGMTASFIKELIRRAVLKAVVVNEVPTDHHLLAALDDLLADQEAITRVFLGVGRGSETRPDGQWEQGGGCASGLR